MSIFLTRPALRWLAPVTVAGAVLGVGLGVNVLTAAAEPTLPARSAAQLLVDLETARLDGLSGTVVQRSDLGLPSLPGMAGQGSSDLTSLVSGSHTLRVWYAGPDSARIALMGTLGESDIIRNGTDVWTWSSRDNTATHRKLPAEDGKTPPLDPSNLPKTPQDAANAALAALDPTTVVSTGSAARVAGRSAYELVLAPRDTASLIGQVRLAIDAKEHVPLRVQVYARAAQDAAFEVAFTSVNFSRPNAAQFKFNPPPGATVTEATTDRPDATKGPRPAMAMVGKGWTSVLVARISDGTPAVPNGSTNGDRRGNRSPLGMLPTVSGAWGSGHVLSSKLFTVLLTDDGRVLVGAVSQAQLLKSAADPAAALK
jgi:outer membrane lipoprotein-sorting protein